MNRLPPELHQLILEHVDLFDLLQLRLVSKFLRAIVNSFRVKEFIVLDRQDDWSDLMRSYVNRKSRYFYLDRPSNFLNVVDTSKFGLLFNGVLNMRSLKCLVIQTNRNHRFKPNLTELNRFDMLEYLDFQTRDFWHPMDEEFTLSLPLLRVLRQDSFCSISSLIFDTPRLQAFAGIALTDRITFRHPHTVTHLQTFIFDPSYAIFQNLQDCCCIQITQESFRWFLDTFPQLTTLRCHVLLGEPVDLLDERALAQRNNLELYFRGVRVILDERGQVNVSNRLLARRFFQSASLLPFYLEQLNELEDGAINERQGFNYVLLVNLIRINLVDMPLEFFAKFHNIQFMEATNQRLESNPLLHFISNLPILTSLWVRNCGLPQTFFDRLPAVSSLFSLVIEQATNNSDPQLDFSFLGRTKHLRFFTTNQQLELSEAMALDRMKHLIKFRFSHRNHRFEITQNGEMSRLFDVAVKKVASMQRLRYEEIVRWFADLRGPANIVQTRSRARQAPA